MQHKTTWLKIVGLIIILFTTRFASANAIIPIPTQPQQAIITPGPPSIDAKSYILIDANSGKVLAEKNADTHLAPASLTKLMSLYVISSALKNGSIHSDDKVRISTKAWKTGGSRMFIKAGDEVPVQDLMQGIIVASGNDATVAMAEYVAGTEEAFTSIMNAQAKNLGMNDSHFLDSTGLPNPNHYSTARDLATLARSLTQTYPEDYKLFSEKSFTYNHIHQSNRNRLLWHYPYADGLKTGHTEDAGYCLVASAIKDGMRLISVIMGAPSDQVRTEDSIRLLTYGYRFFETHKLYNASTELMRTRVWKAVNKETALGLNRDFYITLPSGQFKNIQTNIKLNQPIKAPIIKGQTYGTLNILLNGEVLSSQPLIALDNNAKGSMLRGVTDALSYSYTRLFSPSTEKANNG
ncbi:MAG: dacC [Gammaproteobacteria bacterium]|jgi:D-alanyl-D-alanine carboxypeptidase (penicillin-binding protein 5/6)|nr:dacC [Gammaproteobacteria bacterium]